MIRRFFTIFWLGGLCFLFGSVPPIFAHEAYVLSRQDFQHGLTITTQNPFAPLFDTSHLPIFLIVSVLVAVMFLLVFLLDLTPLSQFLDRQLKRLALVGPLLIRLAVSVAFFYGARLNVIFGPELSLQAVAHGDIIRVLLFIISFLIFVGLFTEFAALAAIVILIYITQTFGGYMITYANYLGELIVLVLFGSRFLSIDRYLIGKRLYVPILEKWMSFEIPIVRILYGVALIYAGYTIKFEHQILTVMVYNQYHLHNFFHASAEFIAAGAGLSEIMIGIFIVVGFFLRLTVIISLVFITLSLLYFHEIVWPHFLLYGISISLLMNAGDVLTIDRYLIPFAKRILKRK